jgi:hypothetical protein
MTNNKQQTAVEWFLIECGKYGDTAQIPDEVLEQAKEMEIAGKEMSYDDGYAEGYKRALDYMTDTLKNKIEIKVNERNNNIKVNERNNNITSTIGLSTTTTTPKQ